MLLAAGIVGVITPMLRTQAVAAVDVARLGYASAAMIVALVWAAVAYFFDHMLHRRMAKKFSAYIEAQALVKRKLVLHTTEGTMPQEDEMAMLSDRSDKAFQKYQQFTGSREQARTFDELGFQGLIVIGLLLVAFAFV